MPRYKFEARHLELALPRMTEGRNATPAPVSLEHPDPRIGDSAEHSDPTGSAGSGSHPSVSERTSGRWVQHADLLQKAHDVLL